MNNKIYSNWIKLHNDPKLIKKFPDIIYDSWHESFKQNIDPYKSKPFVYSKKDFEIVKVRLFQMYQQI